MAHTNTEYSTDIYASKMMQEHYPVSFNSLTSDPDHLGSIKEYSPIGDGSHLMPHERTLLFDRVRPRPHTMMRKVTVMGSHVLRYSGWNNSLAMRRYLRQNMHRVRMARQDQEETYWFDRTGQQMLVGSGTTGLLQLQTSAECSTLESDNNSLLGYFNLKLCLGMMCFILTQALLKLTNRILFNMD